MFEETQNPSELPTVLPESHILSPSMTNDGSVTWTIPLQVTVRLGQPTIVESNITKSSEQTLIAKESQGHPALGQALTQLQAARTKTYYDKGSDELNRKNYY